MRPRSRALVALLAATAACAAQEPAAPAPPEPHFIVVRYPQDRDYVVAVVGDRPYTLGDLVAHIDERHYPGFAKALEKSPGLQRMLQSDLMAPWVRHFADIKALELQSADAGIDPKALDETISARLKQDFEAWLATYVKGLEQQGHPTELSQRRVNSLLADWQLRNGLATELQGWLDHLETGEYTRKQLHDFFTANARAFGGMVTIAHIMVQHRDAGTGILLKDAERGRAAARLADIKARLEPDGSNFFEVARLFSEDTRTAPDGGRIAGIHRFDDRLPAELCRAAWELKDGETSDVVESRYGWHLMLRLEFNQNILVLFTDDAIPAIELVMRRAMQERRLFEARATAKVQLRL